MMNLEIADYERTIASLNEQIGAKVKAADELNAEISRLGERADGLQKQLGS